MVRYGIYFAPPPGSKLWHTGTAWLGRDPEGGASLQTPALAGYTTARIEALTMAARRYGFHATVKAPFRLAPKHSVDALHAALSAFCAARTAFSLPALEVAELGEFIALRPRAESPELRRFAFDCVVALDTFRAPATAEEMARRQAAGLSARQEDGLRLYGYPYIGDEFRFHLTLTDRLGQEDRARLRPLLAELFAPALEDAMMLSELALFVQPELEAPFRLVRRYALGDYSAD